MKTPEFLNIAYFSKEIDNLDSNGLKMLDSIFELIERIEPYKKTKKETHWSFWVFTDRGGYEEYKKQFKDEARSKKEFETYYPDEYTWYPFTAVKYEGIKYFILQGLIVSNKSMNVGDRYLSDYNYVLSAVKEEIQKVVEMVTAGTYNDFVKNNLPYEMRYGTIPRKAYFDEIKEEKNDLYKDLKQEELDEIKKYIAEEGEEPTTRVQHMTFNKYFQMAIDCYNAIGKKTDAPTLFENFRRYGEDFGGLVLEKLNYDSEEDFEDYYSEKIEHMGGHPWGILMGSSRTRIMLYPVKDGDGFYFRFGANPNWMFYETVRCYLTLKRNGYPVCFPCGDEVVEYIDEKDLIGFVPDYVFPAYCQASFDTRVNDFRHYDEVTHKKIFNKIKWQEIKEIRIVDKQKKK